MNKAKIKDKYRFTTKPTTLKLADYQQLAFIPMEMIPTDRLFCSEFISKSPNAVTSGTYFEEGDLLVSKITPCFENGKQAIARNIPNGFGIATTEVIPIKPIPDESDLPYLAYCLLDRETRHNLAEKMEGATGRQRLSKSVLQDWEIPFPSLMEQKAIGVVLSKIQSAIEIQEKIISAIKELKASTLRRIFQKGVFSEKVTETKIGQIPENWSVEPLQNLIELHRGYDLPSQKRRMGSFPIISSSGLTGFHDSFKIKGPGVVTGRYGTLGKVFFIEEDYWPLNTTLYVSNFKGNNPRFVSFLLESMNITYSDDKSAVPGINRNDLHAILVGKPRLIEQIEIGKNLSLIESKLTLQTRKMAKIKSIFSSTLHELMTGELRFNEVLEYLSKEVPNV